jgi:hypothetical protein
MKSTGSNDRIKRAENGTENGRNGNRKADDRRQSDGHERGSA